ncbi:MAG: gluconate:proton symporter [Armatimonadetes bacterium]|nr:gluconate:proton symporter [Armatimonadota bacterium]
MRKAQDTWSVVLFVIALLLAFYIYTSIQPPTLWGLVPILLYAVLVLLGVDVVLATLSSLVVAIVMTGTGAKALAGLMAESLGAFITVVGMIIMLGGGLGQVTRETGVAEYLVRTIVYRIGVKTRTQAQIGVMLTSTILVAALGTLAGANAILAPIVIPIVAALGFTPPALAAMLHAAGAPGLFIGPFTPPVVTLTGTAKVAYVPYLLAAGIPMAIVTWITGFFMVRWIQRRTEGVYAYDESDIIKTEHALGPEARRGTWAFVLTLLIMVIYGISIKAGYSYAILAMLVTSFTTGLAARLGLVQILQAIYAGASRLIWLFFLFWLFNPLVTLVGKTKAYDALLEALKPLLATVGSFGFAVIAAVIGWLGVSGAAVAQVVLMNEVFGPTVQQLALPALVWVAVLLASSQIDWFGPFPNADMIGQMGLARSKDLRMQMYNGWAIMGANCILFLILFWILL